MKVAGAAPARPALALRFTECDDDLARETRRIVGVELRAFMVIDGATPHEKKIAADVRVTCRADTADIVVDDPITAKVVQRTVSSVPAAGRARLLALAVAELLEASWAELELRPEPKVAPATPRPVPPEHREAARDQVRHRALIETEVLFDARTFFVTGDLALGGGLRSALWLDPAYFVSLDLKAHRADVSRNIGNVVIEDAAFALAFGVAGTWGPIRGSASGGWRTGIARLSGFPSAERTSGRDMAGVWGGPELSTELCFFPRAHVRPTLGLGLGAALLQLRGRVSHDQDVDMRGLWMSGSLGVGFQ